MAEIQHTPAPWTIVEYGDDDVSALVIHRGETENRICFMATPGSRDDPAIIAADASLIAAAPDLLSIARRWVALDGGAWHSERYARERTKLLFDTAAAVAKATTQIQTADRA